MKKRNFLLVSAILTSFLVYLGFVEEIIFRAENLDFTGGFPFVYLACAIFTWFCYLIYDGERHIVLYTTQQLSNYFL